MSYPSRLLAFGIFLVVLILVEAADKRLSPHMGAPPFAGALANKAMEDAGQTGLIGEARPNCDLGERQRRRHHQML